MKKDEIDIPDEKLVEYRKLKKIIKRYIKKNRKRITELTREEAVCHIAYNRGINSIGRVRPLQG